jgi:hypothetical protein
MKLREHPMMIRTNGYRSWPPLWTTADQDRDKKPIGEVGTLEDAVMRNLIDNKIFMFMQYQGSRYMGFVAFDDSTFCRQIYGLLKSKAGLSIKEIGDIDLSYTL